MANYRYTTLDLGGGTRVYDTTGLPLDASNFQALLRAAGAMQGVIVPIPYNGQKFEVKFLPLPVDRRAIILKGPSVTAPKWTTSWAETRRLKDKSGASTTTSVIAYSGDLMQLNHGVGVELCQSVLQAAVRGTTQDTAMLELVGKNGQEAVCNSFGFAYSLKSSGVPYDAYVRSAQSKGVQTPIGEMPLAVFPANIYNALPASIVKK